MKIENFKLKIGINGYFLSRPFTGFGVYTIGLLKALDREVDKNNTQIVVFSPVKYTTVKFINIQIRVIPEKNIFASLAKIWWEQVQLPRALKQEKIKLVHHFYPATFIRKRGIKQITSIHDATPWHFKEHNLGLKVKLLRGFMVWSNKKADLIVSVSNYAKNDVASVYGIPKDKIKVIYNGIDSRYRRQITSEGKKRIINKYDINAPYIFYVGGFEIHKNVRRLFLAFAKASAQINHQLIIAGGVFSKARLGVYKDYFDLPKLIKEYKLENRVRMIGVVPDEDLPALYQGADLYIMLSLAEGFNLPLVQAFASKVPTIAANSLATEEIAGKATYLVDGMSVEAISDAIIYLLLNKVKKTELVTLGIEKQTQYRWENAVSRLLEIYTNIID